MNGNVKVKKHVAVVGIFSPLSLERLHECFLAFSCPLAASLAVSYVLK